MIWSLLNNVLAPATPKHRLPFEYEVVLSARRRSLSIEIARAHVVVRAPHFVGKADIDAFVHAKAAWVEQKLAVQRAQLAALPHYRFNHGAQVPFLGGYLELVVHKHSSAGVSRFGQQLRVILSSRRRIDDELQAKELVSRWYQQQALVLLQDKTHDYAARIGARCTGISLKATRSKWGHCTAQGAIQYNWQILLAPESIVDYLVAHEVSHLLHHNHSPAFWAQVARLCPDYKARRAWLKAKGAQLMF